MKKQLGSNISDTLVLHATLTPWVYPFETGGWNGRAFQPLAVALPVQADAPWLILVAG